jgi:hypothetical protein
MVNQEALVVIPYSSQLHRQVAAVAVVKVLTLQLLVVQVAVAAVMARGV